MESIGEKVYILYGFDLCNYINILHIESNKNTSIRIKINLKIK